MEQLNYQRILERFINKYPHHLDTIEEIVQDGNKVKQHNYLDSMSLKEIIISTVWNTEEKIRLLNIFNYNTCGETFVYQKNYHESNEIPAYLYTIKFDLLSSFNALMIAYQNSKKLNDELYSSKFDFYRNVFFDIASEDKINQELYLKAVINNLDPEINLNFAPYYEGTSLENICNKSIFSSILKSKNLELIRLYLPYISNINTYFQEAVATKSIEIVKLFLENGADVNYVEKEAFLGKITPLKMAIMNSDYEMFQFLINHGANPNLKVDFSNLVTNLSEYDTEIFLKFEDYGNDSLRKRLMDKLKYINESSPLEYAIYLVNNGDLKFSYDIEKDSYLRLKNYQKIIDDLFDLVEENAIIDCTQLIRYSLQIKNLETLKKYTNLAIDNKSPIDFNSLFSDYFLFHLNDDMGILQVFLDFLNKYDPAQEIVCNFFNYYFIHDIKSRNYFQNTDFNRLLLNNISKEKRCNYCLVPYCKDLPALELLLSLGYEINQVDEDGRNILYYLFKNESSLDRDLFDYLLKNLNLSQKDNKNKNALYYGMLYLDENTCIGIQNPKRVKIEEAVSILVSRMTRHDVCDSELNQILEKKLYTSCDYSLQTYLCEYLFEYHKVIFEKLIDKGFKLSEKILNTFFDYSYVYFEERIDNKEKQNYKLDFLYEKLDNNTEIQILDIQLEFQKIITCLNNQVNLSFEEFKIILKEFNYKIISLNSFYLTNIKKKINPNRYLEYVKDKYNTTYNHLNDYLLFLIIRGIQKYGNESLEEILNLLPNYDINNYVVEADVNFSWWSYVAQTSNIIGTDEKGYPLYGNEHFSAQKVEEGDNENVEFTGNLMQYAILIDNLSMVRLLQKRGANLQFFIENEDYTWNYINSYTMLNYIESFLRCNELLSKEEVYFQKLLKGEKTSNKHQELILKK